MAQCCLPWILIGTSIVFHLLIIFLMPDTPPPIRARISCSRGSTYVRIILAFAGTLIKNSQLRVMKLSGSIFEKSFENILITKKKKKKRHWVDRLNFKIEIGIYKKRVSKNNYFLFFNVFFFFYFERNLHDRWEPRKIQERRPLSFSTR